MALAPGTRLGVYDITAPIGEGGMGQVWRATDTTLGRQVAIKILPDAFAADPDRLARFEREAKTLASLNHPHIAAIYAVEKSGGTLALVMELVEGEDLSQRIARGAIPLDEALPIAKQIAEALEAAHEQGIIHRDLKPANIKVRADGTVKVLDFGLARTVDASEAGRTGGTGGENSPTITSPAMTQAGMILGTAAYMAPEQARGKILDRRADIWAFGAVLFEMLTGTRAFGGEDVTDTIVSVISKEPDWTRLPSSLSPTLAVYLKRCLHKDPKQRVGDIRDVRLALEGAFETATPQTPPFAAATPRSLVARALPWSLFTMSTAALMVAVVLWAPWRSAPVPAPRRLLASIGADASLQPGGAPTTLSPDGTMLAFTARQGGVMRLFIRNLDQLQATALAGTEGAESPFFSPDGQWLAFFAGGKLKKISVTGGAAVTLCDAPQGFGGTWIPDDTIVFTPSSIPGTTLMRVSAAGGAPASFSAPSQGAVTQRWPQVLPGGQAVLFTESASAASWDTANLVVVPMSGGAPRVVVRGASYGRYVTSGRGAPQRDERATGHLIYVQQGTVFAVGFDLTRLETVGQSVPVIEGVAATSAAGGAQLAVSSEGTLVYVPGTATTLPRPIDWLTRDGKTAVLRAADADWGSPRFSPDGQKLAVEIFDGKQRDVWVYEWARDTLTQLTFDPGEDRYPVWTPDGGRLVFASDRAVAGVLNLYGVNADGTGDVTRLTDSPATQIPWSWHPSGKFLAFHTRTAATAGDLMLMPMEWDAGRGWTPGAPTVFLSTPGNEVLPMFSPDGRWIAYLSDESGNLDVYVRPFPGAGGKWRISATGGATPRWSATTRELLFLTTGRSTSTIMAAPYAVVGDSFRAAAPQAWSPASIQSESLTVAVFDVHPDGKRVATAVSRDQGSGVRDKVVFVFNFGDYLRTIAPGNK